MNAKPQRIDQCVIRAAPNEEPLRGAVPIKIPRKKNDKTNDMNLIHLSLTYLLFSSLVFAESAQEIRNQWLGSPCRDAYVAHCADVNPEQTEHRICYCMKAVSNELSQSCKDWMRKGGFDPDSGDPESGSQKNGSVAEEPEPGTQTQCRGYGAFFHDCVK